MSIRFPRVHGLPWPSAARWVEGILLATVFAGTLAISAAAAKTTDGDAIVRVERGRISADVRDDVPVVSVLAQVARGIGAVVFVRGELGNARPQSFTDATIQDGDRKSVV